MNITRPVIPRSTARTSAARQSRSAATHLASLDRYRFKLAALPPPGSGHGFHTGILGVASVGRSCGVSRDQIFSDLRRCADTGTRHVPDAEIVTAIEKAFAHDYQRSPSKHSFGPAYDGVATLHNILKLGSTFSEADLWECSPIRTTWPAAQDAEHLLGALYDPDDILFIGDHTSAGSNHVRKVSEWLTMEPARWPHIIPNPLTGHPAPTAADAAKLTLRGNGNVRAYRFAVIEFDHLPKCEQIRFWLGIDLPVAALIDSGGRSVHAWLKVDAADGSEWNRDIRPLYRSRLVPLGADGACANPARLSRMPGHYRTDKRCRQRLLFLDPSARGPRHFLMRGAA